MSSRERSGRRGHERGSSAVEFALVLPLLMLVVLGTIQYGWYFYVSHTTNGAVTSVARRLSVGDCWVGSAALSMAQQQAPTVSSVVKSPTDLTAAVPGQTQIQVTATADADVLHLLPLPNGGLVTRTVQVQLEDVTATGACP